MLELKPMIHKFKMKDKYFCLDVNSGIIHVIDEFTDKVLDIYDGTNREAVHQAFDGVESPEEINELLDELDSLIKDEMLYAPMSEDFKLVAAEKPIVKALCLNIAHDCNLACRYCFASQGDYGGVKRELMSFDVAKRAVDFLISMSGPRQHLEIDFFGGEPLMNWEVVKQTIEYAEKVGAEHNKIFKMTMTTNGVLLTQEKIDYLNEHKLSMVLSIDGREEVHNHMRPSAGGTDTYKTVAKNLINAVKQRHGLEYYARGTYTHNNLDFTKDVIAMSDLGFEHLSMEPVVGKEGDYVLREEDLPALMKEYEKLADLYLERQRKVGVRSSISSTSVWTYIAAHVWLNACAVAVPVMNTWPSYRTVIFTHAISLSVVTAMYWGMCTKVLRTLIFLVNSAILMYLRSRHVPLVGLNSSAPAVAMPIMKPLQGLFTNHML